MEAIWIIFRHQSKSSKRKIIAVSKTKTSAIQFILTQELDEINSSFRSAGYTSAQKFANAISESLKLYKKETLLPDLNYSIEEISFDEVIY